jgi:AcrR family transcriptional regulator
LIQFINALHFSRDVGTLQAGRSRANMIQVRTSSSAATRDRLMDVAERLYVERGPDDVSLREILREAGQRNQSALQYHFGGRRGLLDAIAQRRQAQLEARRRRLLDETLAQSESLGLRSACAVLLRAPFLLCREDRTFREFLGRFGQLVIASDRALGFNLEREGNRSLTRMQTLIRQALLRLPPELLALRAENAYGTALLAMARRARGGEPFRGRRAELFFENLVDQVTAMLDAPVSEATRAQLTPRGQP